MVAVQNSQGLGRQSQLERHKDERSEIAADEIALRLGITWATLLFG